MVSYDYDLAVIGGGAAGLTVSSGAAQLGARTLLVEKENALGGDCLHYGCVPSKTLIKTASVYQTAKRMKEYGLPEIQAEPVDFSKVASRIQSVIDRIQKHDSVERFNGLGVKVEFGHPEFSDEHSVILSGRRISAAKWVIASGSSPAVPGIDGLNKIDFLTNRELFSLDRLPTSMTMLGAGPVAVEMAQAFTRLGTEVTVIQRSGQILSKEDKDMADLVMESLRAEGVRIILNAAAESVRDTDGGKEVVYRDLAGERQSLQAERVLVALGRSPNIEGMGLESIGIDLGNKGIKADKRMRTSHKHIYAAGDINGNFQFTHAAGYEGGIVVSNAVFHLPRKADYTWMPWCTYTSPELASIGMNEKSAARAGIKYQLWSENFADNDRALAEGEGRGKIKMILDEKEKPIGVQICGHRAGDIISEWVALLNGGVKLSTLAGSIHPYPTLAEINKKIGGSYISPKIFSGKVKKALKLFFRLRGPE